MTVIEVCQGSKDAIEYYKINIVHVMIRIPINYVGKLIHEKLYDYSNLGGEKVYVLSR